MKKLIAVMLICTAFAQNTTAQTEKSNLLFGGNVAFNSSDGNSVLITNPNAGMFIVKNFALGITSDLKIQSNQYPSIAVGPFVRMYFANKPTGAFFGQASYDNFSSNATQSSALGAKLGYAYFINKMVGLESSLGFESGGGNNNFLVNIGLQIYLKN